MRIPRTLFFRVGLCSSATIVATSALPATAGSEGRTARPTLAAKLQYGPGISNHPVHVVPSSAVKIPEGWPVDADGTIKCLTCHEALPRFDAASGLFLRDFDEQLEDPTDFCARCHVNGNYGAAETAHWLAVGVAHVGSGRSGSGRATAGTPELDTQTKQCLGCHDGVSAGESLNKTPWSRGRGSFGDKQRNHPVGVIYPDRASRGSSVRFRPANLLPGKVHLPDGKVSCLSCHNLYSREEHLLTVPIEGSALCFTCHDMD